ncbi:MAG TPA: BON domain-containing protein [Methylophilaceae bacterium]|jgi:hyperosmotically inducible protein
MNKKLTVTSFMLGAMLVSLTTYAADADTSNHTTAKTYVSDSVITTKVKAKLAEAKLGTLVHVSVDTDNKGAVTLSGTAKTQEVADKAGEIATSTEGVTSVQNNIKVVPDKS